MLEVNLENREGLDKGLAIGTKSGMGGSECLSILSEASEIDSKRISSSALLIRQCDRAMGSIPSLLDMGIHIGWHDVCIMSVATRVHNENKYHHICTQRTPVFACLIPTMDVMTRKGMTPLLHRLELPHSSATIRRLSSNASRPPPPSVYSYTYPREHPSRLAPSLTLNQPSEDVLASSLLFYRPVHAQAGEEVDEQVVVD
jgi:hypothetical protein